MKIMAWDFNLCSQLIAASYYSVIIRDIHEIGLHKLYGPLILQYFTTLFIGSIFFYSSTSFAKHANNLSWRWRDFAPPGESDTMIMSSHHVNRVESKENRTANLLLTYNLIGWMSIESSVLRVFEDSTMLFRENEINKSRCSRQKAAIILSNNN